MTRLNLFLLALLVASALALVTSRHQSRKLFIEIERGQNLAQQYKVEWDQLQLEQSTWAMPGRIEKVAREKLQLVPPAANRIQVIAGAGGRL
ncbi:MAG: cell division protein FtsL [Betaproteobacteria bacterium]|nr:cell division protein FtsL [Betaproteobacteria bacterium]